MMADAATVFHDVQLEDEPHAVHATLPELYGLDESIRAKMTLYHYGDQWDRNDFEFVASEFAGFARPYRRYRLFEDDHARLAGRRIGPGAAVEP